MATLGLLLPGLPARPAKKATIISVDGRLAWTVPYIDAGTDFDDVGQEWATIERHPAPAVTYRRGPKLARATLSVHAIHRDPNRSIESEVTALKQLADNLAPVIVAYGVNMATMSRSGAWVITNASMHILQRVQGTNDARWFDATLELLEAVAWDQRSYQDMAAFLTALPDRTSVAGSRTAATYTWRAGDSLLAVAQRVYGDANRWTAIGDLNGIRDPQQITPGTVLRLP